MTNGVYGYYDIKNRYVIYIGQDAHIDEEKRHKEHFMPSLYCRQKINQTLQSNPDRYVYFKFIEGNYTQDEIDDFEKEAIKLLKTYKYDYPERSVFNFTPGGGLNPSIIPEIAKKISKSISGENNPMYGKQMPKEVKQKISNSSTGKKHSSETKIKMSISRNSSGYYNVHKHKRNTKQGFIWVYQYYKNNKKKYISSIDIEKLEQKVKAKGLLWIKY